MFLPQCFLFGKGILDGVLDGPNPVTGALPALTMMQLLQFFVSLEEKIGES